MTSIPSHPQRNTIRLQLRQNPLLAALRRDQWEELEPLLIVGDHPKGDHLVHQGDEEMEQIFILDGMLKRVVSNPEGREMILRFAGDTEMDTSYAAWRLRRPIPYSIVAVTRVRTAQVPMAQWVEFLSRHAELKARFEYEVMKLMSEVMAHTITLHLLDAPGRLSRFHRKHPELAGRIPKKELAAYLNLTPETLSRLKRRFGRDF
ncbi:MAG: cyclic nucleotide-binding protein [Betaproteobacteria bacterium RIFCSPLOWO2_02_FULL_66_14]|nr:MAG: cyclic nucleotide-binding protein [Betaproteobacteria bacterium RIFCSPLOWO2_02_FULL_66_14]